MLAVNGHEMKEANVDVATKIDLPDSSSQQCHMEATTKKEAILFAQ